MRLIVGIGNPGREYEATRHNIGFMIVERIAAQAGLAGWSSRFESHVADHHVPGGVRALLMKPTTFVNRTGEAVQAAMAFHKVTPQDILVIVDDIHLALGDLRLRGNGGAGGHNGLRDIEARIGQDYARLRCGIGKPPAGDGDTQVAHVLGRFTETERADVELLITKAADAARAWMRDGVTVACAFNGPLRPPPKPVKPPRPAPPAESD